MYANDALLKWGDYKGSQTKPKYFDDFWDEGKLKIDQLELNYHLTSYELYSTVAIGYNLEFIAHDGVKIHCQLITPIESKVNCPVQIQFHGYHGNSGDWGDKIALAAEGYYVFAMDVRGQGGQSGDSLQTKGGTLKGHIIRGIEDGKDCLFYRQVFLDVYHLAKIVFSFPQINCSEVSVYGASQGGALAIVCAALEPRIKQAFVLYPFLSDYREAFRLSVQESAYEELAYWFRFKDPLHQRECLFFDTLDYIDIQYLAPRVEAQVLWGMGLEDAICHPKTQFAVYNQLVGQKELLIYPEYGHEYIPGFSDNIRKELYKKRRK